MYYYNRYIDEGNEAPTEDAGSTIRSTMKAMQKYGVPLEADWPYVPAKYNEEPPAVATNDAQQYGVLTYFAISENSSKITNMKKSICAGVPVMFGSEVSDSIFDVGSNGLEPYSTKDIAGGHARVVLGYDDTKSIPGTSVKGAFLVRNSWGTSWGNNGYSWVSYKVFTAQQTDCMGITTANLPTPTPSPTPDPTPVPGATCQEKLDAIKKIIEN